MTAAKISVLGGRLRGTCRTDERMKHRTSSGATEPRLEHRRMRDKETLYKLELYIPLALVAWHDHATSSNWSHNDGPISAQDQKLGADLARVVSNRKPRIHHILTR